MHVIRERYFPLLNCDVYFANVQVCVYLCVCVCVCARAHARMQERVQTNILKILNRCITTAEGCCFFCLFYKTTNY